jgi:hypothetical protein
MSGGNTSQPVVLMCDGQSNAVGADSGGNDNNGAGFVGSISAGTLTVTSMTTSSGLIATGQTLGGNGVPAGVTVAGQSSGTTGGVGVYTLSNSGFSTGTINLGTGTKPVGANIWMTNAFSNATDIVPAAYGVAPLNQSGSQTGATAAATSQMNICIEAANAYRALYPESRPIVVAFVAGNGQSISDWIDDGAAPFDLWANGQLVVNSLLNARYGVGNWTINQILWIQGEQDGGASSFTGTISGATLTVQTGVGGAISTGTVVAGLGVQPNTVVLSQLTGTTGKDGTYQVSISQTLSTPTAMSTGSAYGSQAAYAGGFARLVGRWQALPQWSPKQSRITVQELGTWNDNGSASRNDFLRTLSGGAVYPFVTVVSAAGMTESLQTPGPHFDGASLKKLGQKHASAGVAGAMTNTYQSPFQLAWNAKQITGGTAQAPTLIGVGDVINGGNFYGQSGYYRLPDPANSSAPIIYTAQGNSIIQAYGSRGGQSLLAENDGFLTLRSSYTVKQARTVMFVPNNTTWFVISLIPKIGGMLDCIPGDALLAASTNGTYSNSLQGCTIPMAGGNTISFRAAAGARTTLSVLPGGANSTLTSVDGANIIGPDGAAVSSYTLPAGDAVVVEGNYTTGNALVGNIVSDLFWSGSTNTDTIPTSGTTDIATMVGYGRQRRNVKPAGTLAALTEPLPATPRNGQEITFYFDKAITALSFSGGTASTWTNGTAVTAGQKISLVYSSASGVWY